MIFGARLILDSFVFRHFYSSLNKKYCISSVVNAMLSSSSNSLMTDRFRGCLIGALIGDCLGARFEFDPGVDARDVVLFLRAVADSRKNTSALAESEAGCLVHNKMPHLPLPYTDDTAMTRSVATSLLCVGGYDAADMADRFVAEYRAAPDRGYGAAVTKVFDALAEGKRGRHVYLPAARQFDGSGSYGNGGAMRVAPVALFQYAKKCPVAARLTDTTGTDLDAETKSILTSDLPDDICRFSTRITHTNALGVEGAMLQCVAVKLALALGMQTQSTSALDTNAFLDDLVNTMEKTEKQSDEKPLRKRSRESSSGSGSDDDVDDEDYIGIQRGDSSVDRPYVDKLGWIRTFLEEGKIAKAPGAFGLKPVVKKLGNYVSAQGSVPMAIYCFLRAAKEEGRMTEEKEKTSSDSVLSIADMNCFQRAVCYAICSGGDTDTIASMTGAIAGAFWGVGSLPQGWVDACEGREEAERLADGLARVL